MNLIDNGEKLEMVAPAEVVTPPKKKMGRPRKHPLPEAKTAAVEAPEPVKKQDNARFIQLRADALLPVYMTDAAACADVAMAVDCLESISGYVGAREITVPVIKGVVTLPPHSRFLVPTGLKAVIDKDYKVLVWGRSGLSLKKGLILANGVGTIDADYDKEIFVILANTTDQRVQLSSGDRIAQVSVEKVEKIDGAIKKQTSRTGGFASTGGI